MLDRIKGVTVSAREFVEILRALGPCEIAAQVVGRQGSGMQSASGPAKPSVSVSSDTQKTPQFAERTLPGNNCPPAAPKKSNRKADKALEALKEKEAREKQGALW